MSRKGLKKNKIKKFRRLTLKYTIHYFFYDGSENIDFAQHFLENAIKLTKG